MNLSRYDIISLAGELYQYSSLFSTLIENSNVVLHQDTENIAWVEFDKDGNAIQFCFSEKFWNETDINTKLFVLSHEILHIFLKHGIRSKKRDEPLDIKNIAMDVVVNEMLFRNYHFDDTFATRMNLATLDSAVKMFKLSPKDVSKLKNSLDFETVLDVLSKSQKERSSEKTNFFKLDIHGEELNDNETNSQQQIDMQNFFKTLNSSRNIDTSEDLKNISKFLSPFKGEHNCVYRSLDVRNIKFTTNKKWENIIFDVLHKMIGRDCIENEKWLPSRRNNYIYEMTGLDLPSMHEEEAYIEINKKRKICFFMDVSESCSEHTRRFMAAVRSINQNLFDVSFFVFNIRCFKVKIDEKYIPWGGGTEFVCIEKQINEEFKEYPDAVFVITDGDGGEIKPRFPERWHWFLTEHPKIDVLPTESKKYQLKDFEG